MSVFATPTESQQAAHAALDAMLGELADMEPEAAEAHVLHTGVPLLGELDPGGRAVWSSELLRFAPGLDADVLCASIAAEDRRQGRRGTSSVAMSPSPVWRPFPTEALPYSVARYVVEVSAAIGCDRSMVALPALACLAGTIGNRRRVRLKRGWTEPAIIWAAIVARSGTRKSPALSEPTRPLRYAEAMPRHSCMRHFATFDKRILESR